MDVFKVYEDVYNILYKYNISFDEFIEMIIFWNVDEFKMIEDDNKYEDDEYIKE
jgi:hypothetical protein